MVQVMKIPKNNNISQESKKKLRKKLNFHFLN